MAKAMPALAEERQRRLEADAPPMEEARDVRPDSVGFLIAKNGLFWGSIALSCVVIYALAASLF